MKNFDIFDRVGAAEFKSYAKQKRDEVTKEFKKVSKDFVDNVKTLDLKFVDADVLENIKDNINNAITRVQDLEVLETAKEKVSDARNQMFTILNIPSQNEVNSLIRKVATLEKKVNALKKHTKH